MWYPNDPQAVCNLLYIRVWLWCHFPVLLTLICTAIFKIQITILNFLNPVAESKILGNTKDALKLLTYRAKKAEKARITEREHPVQNSMIININNLTICNYARLQPFFPLPYYIFPIHWTVVLPFYDKQAKTRRKKDERRSVNLNMQRQVK